VNNMKKSLYIGIPIIAVLLLAWNVSSSQRGSAELKVGTRVGDLAPSFTLTTIDGEYLSSADVRGKALVITSSAAWCQTCVMEAQQFAPVYKKYKDSDVVFLTIDIDPRDTIEAIQTFRTHTDTPWAYADAPGATQLIKDYSMDRFEITYVIDKEGVIQYKDGNITDSQILDTLLGALI